MDNELIVINLDNYILVETIKDKELYIWNYNFEKIKDMGIVYFLYKKYEYEKVFRGDCASFNDIRFFHELDDRFVKITLHSFKRKLKI